MVILLAGCSVQDSRFDSIIEAFNWVHENIKPVSDEVEYWQTPSETLDRMAGDCEDLVILLMEFAHEMGYRPEFQFWGITYEYPDGYVVEMHHAMAMIDGDLYDPMFGLINDTRNYQYERSLTYEQTMNAAGKYW